MSLIVLYFLHDTSVLSFYIDVVLTLSIQRKPFLYKPTCNYCSWWRHQMETFSALLTLYAGNSLVTGEFPAQRPVTRSFDVFSDLCLSKQLSKQSWQFCTHNGLSFWYIDNEFSWQNQCRKRVLLLCNNKLWCHLVSAGLGCNMGTNGWNIVNKQRVLMHGHQGWSVTFICDMYIRVVYSFCWFCCLFIIVTWWYMWCIVWASGNQEQVQGCFVTLWLFIISCYSLYKTTLCLLCSWKPAWSLK